MDGACILAGLVSIVSCPAGASEVPDRAPLVRQGQPGRRVLGGRWQFRLEGRKRWRGVTIPHDWNGADRRLNRSGVGWYRRELRLPRLAAGTRWILRFEAAGHQTTVYLNGRRIRRHHGNYLPFEAVVTGLRRGSNRLTVRVSSRRTRNDLTHWRRARPKGFGQGGWWNFGGIHREVSVRPAPGLDISRAQALTRMACPACAARVEVRALVRNIGSATVRPRVVARAAGQTIELRAPQLAPAAGAEAAGAFTVERPQLWDIGKGRLYDLQVEATGPAGSARHTSRFGIRDVRKFPDGHVELNGRPLFVKGVSMHEDHPHVGSAYRKRHLDAILSRLEQLGATILRSHYPLHPYLMEELDKRGIMVWSGAPINVVQNDRWRNPNVTRAAIKLNQGMVLRDRGHPSVLAFSVANELAIPVTAGQRRFLRAAAAAVRRLDPTRLVALDRVARYGSPSDADPVFGAFDALGVNEYFGWYRGAHKPRPPAYTRHLPAYFDILHRQQPRAALFVTEFGAEANRPGPVREKGTYAFQASYIGRHIAMARSRPFINGAIVWALRDFRVHSAWHGGNPKPRPPYNQKGLISVHGRAKPGFRATCRAFAAIGPPVLAGTACR